MEVEFDGIQFARDGRRILDIPSLRIRDGVTTAILGPNGSGKTTMLRLIAGLERLQQGAVRVGGVPVQPGHHLAYVFQEQVFLRRSVRENLELGLRLRGVSRTDTHVRIDEALRLLGIRHLIDRRADRLSGGEGRRVSLARALCLRAPLVLLDEPLEGLDQHTHSRLLDELPRVLAALDATTILVTHSRDEALRLADDLVVVIDGSVRSAGDKRTVATQPISRDVAEVLNYLVIAAEGRTIAVPPGALRLGSGLWTCSMTVDDVLDLVDVVEVIGRIDATHVRIPLAPGQPAPRPGERVCIATDTFHALD